MSFIERKTTELTPSRRLSAAILPAIFLGIAGFQVGMRYLFLRFQLRDFFFDARGYWIPIAHKLSEGATLYQGGAVDNKTPIWHALNYAVYLTDHYAFVFLSLVGIANAITAYLLWLWLADYGYSKGGAVAGLLYLSTLPLINGHIINVRSFAMVFVMLAVLTMCPYKRGISIAVAVLFSQFSVVAIPVLLVDGYLRNESPLVWSSQFLISGAMTGMLVFAGTTVVYSPDAAIAGFKASFINGGEYITTHADKANPFVYPVFWLENLAQTARELIFVLVPFTLVMGRALYARTWRWDAFTVACCLAVVFLSTLLLKSLAYYWIPGMAFCAAVVGIGVEDWLSHWRTSTAEMGGRKV